MSKGRLLLVPAALSDSEPVTFLPEATTALLFKTTCFIAERAKTARHYLKTIGYPIPLPEVQMSELNKHGDDDLRALLQPCLDGHDCGLISEAGVPGVADPGGLIVREAHRLGIEVLPLVGASSLLMALMASGMNGQRFAFHGYLPKDEHQLASQLKRLEAESRTHSVTQMFIETPYRNEKMLAALKKHLHPQTDLCIAMNITADDQQIATRSISEWKKVKINFDRKPAVFLIFSGELTT